jgi:aminopeptidase N/puromycin-sensitive aminopeptidase
VRANKSSVGDFLNLAEAVKSDSDAEVASITNSSLAGVDEELASTRQEHDALAAWIRRTFAPGYAQLGSPEAGDSPNKRELRAALFGLLGYRGHDPQVITQARKIADQYLADPASVDPTLARAALGVAAENGDAALFSKLQNVYETSHDPILQEGALYLLVQFKDPALLNRALEYAVSNKVRNQDSAIMLAYALEIPENRDQAWQFIKSHWDQVHAQLTVSSGSYVVAAAGSFCSDQAHQNVQSFFADHPVAAADVALKHAIEQIGECVEFRKLQGPNLVSWAAAQPGM